MKLKRELQQEVIELKNKLHNIKKIPAEHFLYHCPQCGNPVLLNKGQNEMRYKEGQSFHCSAKHLFVFKKSMF